MPSNAIHTETPACGINLAIVPGHIRSGAVVRPVQSGVVMSKTAADQIVEMMIDVGIKRVYGLVGDSINPITDAIRRTKGKLQWVHCRNEEVGAFAAGAEALLTGQITACAGSCGPGNLHLIQGLYNSHRN